ncbi:MAG TPA: nuclear transport factor 2 family protein [Flavobacterium sp.]|nr:nuclear transport factor 2 family protein [Flavobacterium sp.]
MAQSHEQIIEKTESELICAMLANAKEKLARIMHPDVVCTNESGELFIGFENQQINNPEVLKIDSVEIVERSTALFNNVAIVNTLEKRTGSYLGIFYSRDYRLTRIWKFSGRRWVLVGTSCVLI